MIHNSVSLIFSVIHLLKKYNLKKNYCYYLLIYTQFLIILLLVYYLITIYH